MFLKVQAFRKHELFNLTSMALTMFFCFFFFIPIFFCLGTEGKTELL